MSKFSLRDVLSGDILTKSWFQRQYKVIGLISVLIFIYIHCGYLAQRQQCHLSQLQQDLQDAYYVQLSMQAEFMEKTSVPAVNAVNLTGRTSGTPKYIMNT